MRQHRVVWSFIAILAIGMLGMSHTAIAQEIAKAREPGGAVTIGATASATVKAIDAEKRIITLERSDGETVDIKCGKEVRNFDQIKVGDQVKAAAIARLVIGVGKSAASPAEETGAMIARTPKGARPGIIITNSEEMTAKIDSVDAAKQTVTLQGPEGKSQTIQVAPDVDLSGVKAGDEVALRITKGVALWVAGPADAQPAAETLKPEGEPAGFALEAATTTATVESIDPAKRNVTLKGEGGNTRTIHLGKECINFDQIKVGDKVKATLAEQVAIAVSKGGAAPSADEGEMVALAPRGAKPGIIITGSADITGQIKSIDAQKRTVTMVEPDGTSRTIKAGPKVDLSALSAGDDVSARITKALAIVVEKP